MKKSSFTVCVFLVIAAMLFTGCSVITNIFDPLPDEYKDGVKFSRDYPDDDLEIYDDAIVYEADEDDEGEITLKYGSEDDLDDLIDFYEDMFDDSDSLIVDESDEGRDDYQAEGRGDGFKFELDIEEASGNYEERVFKTVVEVVITPYEPGEETLQKMQGFWIVCGMDGDISDEYREYGMAMEVKGSKFDLYESFVIEIPETEIIFTDDDTLKYNNSEEDKIADISFEVEDGYEYLVMAYDDYTLYLERSSYDTMLSYQGGKSGDAVIYLDDILTDDELAYYITDIDWYQTYLYYPDGSYDYVDEYNRIFLSSYDYSGVDEFDEESYDMTWYILDSILYFIYDDGLEYSFLVDYEYDGSYRYFYLFDPVEGYNDNANVYTTE